MYVFIHNKCLSSNIIYTALMYLYLYKLIFLISFIFKAHIISLRVSCSVMSDSL